MSTVMAHQLALSDEIDPTECEKDLASLLTNSNSHSAFALVGPPGCGKTTTISSLKESSEIRKHFADGIYTIELDGKGTAYDLCENLVTILQSLRLRQMLARVHPLLLEAHTRMSGIDALIGCLASRALLIFFDDVQAGSEAGECVRNLIQKLGTVQSAKVRVVVATEDEAAIDMLPSDALRIVVEHSVENCQLMLCKYANVDMNAVVGKNSRTEMELAEVRDKCEGRPVYLQLAGLAIREMMARENVDADGVWRWYLAELRDGGHSIRHPIAAEWRSRAVRLNGRLCEEGLGEKCKKNMFLSLCALPRNRSVPVTTLACLWDVKAAAAEKAASAFARVGILAELKGGREGVRRGEEQAVTGYVMHAVVHEAVTREGDAQGAVFVRQVHGRLVDNYYTLLAPERRAEEEGERQWWAPLASVSSPCGEDDGYLTDNLIRHLCSSGRIKETLGVLADYRWTETRVSRSVGGGSLQGFVEDVCRFVGSLPGFTPRGYGETGETVEEIREGMELVGEAARKAMAVVGGKKEELAFQLYGRLECRRERARVVRRFLLSLDRRAEMVRRQEKGVLDM